MLAEEIPVTLCYLLRTTATKYHPPEVAVLRELHDDVERPVLGAGAQQVDDVDVAADHLR